MNQIRARNGGSAIKLLGATAAQCQTDPDWHYLMARAHWLSQDERVAQAMLAKALELRGSDAEYHRFGANLCAKMGKLDEARLHVERMLDASGPVADARVDLILSAVLAQNGRTRSALSLVGRILERSPANLDALYYQGLFEQSLGNAEAASISLERVLQVQPTHPDARRQLAAIHLEAGRSEAALKLLANHAATGKSAEVSFLLSRAYTQAASFPAALSAADDATRLNPNDPRYWRQLGAVLFRTKEGERGRLAIRKAEQLERGTE